MQLQNVTALLIAFHFIYKYGLANGTQQLKTNNFEWKMLIDKKIGNPK